MKNMKMAVSMKMVIKTQAEETSRRRRARERERKGKRKRKRKRKRERKRKTTAENQDTTVAFAATPGNEIFLFACPSSNFFSFTLLVLFLCCLFASAAIMHKGRCKSLTYLCRICA